jgi:SAM-dependent methyltransferase
MEEHDYLAANHESWKHWTEIHAKSTFYDMAGFKAGKNTLHSLDMEEVGDVRGKSLLHLQCHFGQDSMSWARLGAQVTGADFSEDAITLARSLNDELKLGARFVHANLDDLPQVLDGQFDIVYTSGEVLSWLPDLGRWGKVIAHFLKPGGVFYLREIHPVAMIYEQEQGELKIRYPYFAKPAPLRFDVHGSYADYNADYQGVEYNWIHSMSDILNSLLAAGLRLEYVHEFPYTFYQQFAALVQDDAGRWVMPDNDFPLSFSLRAIK